MWLGNSAQVLEPHVEHEADALVAKYLDSLAVDESVSSVVDGRLWREGASSMQPSTGKQGQLMGLRRAGKRPHADLAGMQGRFQARLERNYDTMAGTASAKHAQSLSLNLEYGLRVTEAEGLQLHMAGERGRGRKSHTGYLGVHERQADASRRTSRFEANIYRDGKRTHLGTFSTAVQAAVAYARHVQSLSSNGAQEPTVTGPLDAHGGRASGGDDQEEAEAEEDGNALRPSKQRKTKRTAPSMTPPSKPTAWAQSFNPHGPPQGQCRRVRCTCLSAEWQVCKHEVIALSLQHQTLLRSLNGLVTRLQSRRKYVNYEGLASLLLVSRSSGDMLEWHRERHLELGIISSVVETIANAQGSHCSVDVLSRGSSGIHGGGASCVRVPVPDLTIDPQVDKKTDSKASTDGTEGTRAGDCSEDATELDATCAQPEEASIVTTEVMFTF